MYIHYLDTKKGNNYLFFYFRYDLHLLILFYTIYRYILDTCHYVDKSPGINYTERNV